MNAKDYDVKQKYKLVAPDGGWGYMIVLAVTINLSATTMFRGCFGLMYKEFMEDVGMSSTHLTTMLGIFGTFASLSGFVTHSLLSLMSMRKLAFIATLIYDAGVTGSAFVNSIFSFYITTGILQGIGLGIIFNLSFTILNEYFVHRRLMMISISQTVVALTTMFVPMFIKWSLDEFGYRGTLLLVAGITMNNFFGVALMQPVDRHLKKVTILDCEKNSLLDTNDKLKPIIFQSTDIEGNTLTVNENTQGNYLKKILDALVDKALRKTFLLSCVSFGTSLCMFADLAYVVMLPQALYAANWDPYNVALAVSVMGFGDLAMRVVIIFCSPWIVRIGSEEVYVFGVVLALVSRLGTLWSKSITANMVYIALTGMANCSIAVLTTVVIADAVPPEKFTAAMGMSMLITGVVTLVVGPAIGAVRDLSDSYEAAFYVIAASFGVITVLWIIELLYKKNKLKKAKMVKLQRIELGIE